VAGRGLLALVNDILDISKVEAGQLAIETVPLSLRDKVRNCLALVAEQARTKGLELVASVAEDVPDRIMADPTRLRQVLLNLLSNAVKFTQHGSITLSVEAMAGTPNILRFAVSDTGIGIAPEKLPLLFERFTQADSSTTRQYGGSGLGLAISKRLVELMGGVMKVQSTLGQGSIFSFMLNLERLPDAQVDLVPQTHVLHDKAYRLLLAEDNDMNRQLIAAVLQQAGHDVVSVANGIQAIEAAMHAPFDAILMDVQMPEMDGYMTARALRAAREHGTRIPIIALTANALVDEAQRCRDAGMDFHAPKPVDWPRLFSAIDRLVAACKGDTPIGQVGADVRSGFKAPVLDMAKLTELRGLIGEANTAHLLGMFEIDARARFDIVPKDSDARRAIADEAHSFGGTAGMLGFAELAQACQALSMSAGRGEPLTAPLQRCRAARERAMVQVVRLRGRSAAMSSPATA
jgi:CheY-like chemotaxis protein/HPt (histidine-containing phosphotransfer) domain-containing protein